MTSTAIERVTAWEALDSRGSPTVACAVHLAGGASGVASVPSGASTGAYEAHELRDGGPRYGGLGVHRAVANVLDVLGPAVVGLEAGAQDRVDERLCDADGTDQLRRLGANAVLAVSVATALANADARAEPLWRALTDGDPVLPLPMVNVISGGAHAAGAIDIQDVLVVPVGAGSFAEAIEWAWRVRRGTAEELQARGHPTALVADEGGLGPRLTANREALEVVVDGTRRAGLEPGEQVALALDVAANELHAENRYHLAIEDRSLDTDAWLDELERWTAAFPIVSIEDPLVDGDWAGWAAATRRLGDRVQLLADDLFATNAARLEQGIAAGAANAILVKPNQVGTLTAAARAVRLARESGYATVVSARSGETEDAWLADLAVGWGPGQIKVGSTTRSERTAKWNRLLQIEHERGTDVGFAGTAVLAPFRATGREPDTARAQPS